MTTRMKRKFTPEERLAILQEADREGRTETIRKYNITPSLFDRWRKKYLNFWDRRIKKQVPQD